MLNQKITPVGLDFGNGFVKLSINDKTSKIPAVYAETKPTGQLSAKTGKPMKAKTFSLTFGDNDLWFGQDVLGSEFGQSIRFIDANKYHNDGHIRVLFMAALANHVKQHKIDPTSWGKLAIAASMPPSAYADPKTYKVAEKAYKATLNGRSKPWYVRSSIADTFRISTMFAGLHQEAATLAKTMQFRKPTMIADLGYGTLDLVVVQPNSAQPLFAKSFNVGLVHAFESINDIQQDLAELNVLTDKSARTALAGHFNAIQKKVSIALRHVAGADLILIGGGTKLMTPNIASGFKAMASSVRILDEFSNAKANQLVAGGAI